MNRRKIASVDAVPVRIAVAYLSIWSYCSAILVQLNRTGQRRFQLWPQVRLPGGRPVHLHLVDALDPRQQIEPKQFRDTKPDLRLAMSINIIGFYRHFGAVVDGAIDHRVHLGGGAVEQLGVDDHRPLLHAPVDEHTAAESARVREFLDPEPVEPERCWGTNFHGGAGSGPDRAWKVGARSNGVGIGQIPPRSKREISSTINSQRSSGKYRAALSVGAIIRARWCGFMPCRNSIGAHRSSMNRGAPRRTTLRLRSLVVAHANASRDETRPPYPTVTALGVRSPSAGWWNGVRGGRRRRIRQQSWRRRRTRA